MIDPEKPRPTLKIGLSTLYWLELIGARDLFRSLVNALLQHPQHEFILLAPPPEIESLHRSCRTLLDHLPNFVRPPTAMVRAAQRAERMIRTRSLESGVEITARRQREAFAWLGPEAMRQIHCHSTDYTPEGIEKAAAELDLDVVLPVVEPVNCRPFVSYLYDCQHRYLPQNFTPEVITNRDRHFEQLVRSSKALVVNSEDTKSDLVSLFGANADTIFALPFAPPVVPQWLEDQPKLLDGYTLPERYFIVSNQFWVHKSLGTVLHALQRLHQQGSTDIAVVFTGQMNDPRFPDHADELVKLSNDLGLSDYVHFLGLIPKRDQVEALKHAVAVVQPTLFEGGRGGGSVIDAVGLGIRSIVSDIKINRELPTDGNHVFFRAGDPIDLAEKMQLIWDDYSYQRTPDSELIQRNARQTANLAEALYQAIDAARTPTPKPTTSVGIMT